MPATLREGVEASLEFQKGDLTAYINYALVDATYRFTGELASPNNPFADANGNVLVTPGDHIPGIPRNTLKFGGEYAFTSKFKAGVDVLIVGSQYLIGDNSNLNPQLPLYWTTNIHASYQVTDNIQMFGLVNNLFNNRNPTLWHVLRHDERRPDRQWRGLHQPAYASRPCSRSRSMAASR